MKGNLRYIVVMSILLSFSPLQMIAQEPPEPNVQESSGAPPPPPGLPVDEYLPLLVIAGIAYGLYLNGKIQKV